MTRLLESGAEAFLPDLLAIEEDCFSQPMTKTQLLALCLADSTLWILAESDGAAGGGQIVGSVWCQVVLDEGYIGNVAVRPDFRRRGIADSLLRGLDAAAEEKKLRFLTLEVREGNYPAIALYEKHGYTHIGIRRDYYYNPKENALLMTKVFLQND